MSCAVMQEGRLAESDVGQGSLREARAAAEVEDRVQMYLNRLEERRKQAGLISTPSTDLVQAERSLARVSPVPLTHTQRPWIT